MDQHGDEVPLLNYFQPKSREEVDRSMLWDLGNLRSSWIREMGHHRLLDQEVRAINDCLRAYQGLDVPDGPNPVSEEQPHIDFLMAERELSRDRVLDLEARITEVRRSLSE